MPITLGNHDWSYSNKDTHPREMDYFAAYPVGIKNSAVQPFPNYYNEPPEPPYYYSFEVANVHFLCLTQNIGVSPIQDWVEEDLKNCTKPWKVAFFHQPFHTAGFHPSPQKQIDAWGPLFDKYQVQLICSGHDHSYQRTKRIKNIGRTVSDTGSVQVISGGGGPQFSKVSDPDWNLAFHAVYHYTRVEVRGDTIHFAAVDTGGTVFDQWKLPLVGQPVSAGTTLAEPAKRTGQYDFTVSPNPFKALTRIYLGAQNTEQGKQKAEVQIFNINGKLIETLCSEFYMPNPGIIWSAYNRPSGIYLAKRKVGRKILTRKLILLE
jgi:hypothetical protein